MSCDNVEQTTKAQCDTLKSIWLQTDGPNWANATTTNWMQTNNPCEWDGVVCWGSNVARLYLGDNNLTGQLPDLSALHNLRTLSLYNNQLSGKVPDVTRNKKLEQLYINGNNFSGNLPNLNALPNLNSLLVKHNPLLFGPIVFNGNTTSNVPSFWNTNLCRSNKIDYGHWTDAVAALPECQGGTVITDLDYWDVIPNDGLDDAHGINHMLAMRHYDSGMYSAGTEISFGEGVYELSSKIAIDQMQDITLKGNGIYGHNGESLNTPNAYETVFKKHDDFVLLWDKADGAMVSIESSSNIKIEGIIFQGATADLNSINNKDHGIANINSCGTQIDNNGFVNFGYDAIADYSDAQIDSASPCGGTNHGTSITNNTMYNVCQISTVGDWIGSQSLSIENNNIQHLKCSLQLFSKELISGDGYNNSLSVKGNVITGPGHDYSGYANGIEVSGYADVLIENNTISNGPNFAIALRSHQTNYSTEDFDWGNVTIKDNTIDNYKQAIYVYNEPNPSGYIANINNLQINNNKILSSWDSLNKAHIHLIGQGFNNSVISNNEIRGGLYDIWYDGSLGGISDYGNYFVPSNTFNIYNYNLVGGNLLTDGELNDINLWWLSQYDIYEQGSFKMTRAYAPLKNGQHDSFTLKAPITVEEGKSYLFSAEMKSAWGHPKGSLMVQFRKADGSFHSNSNLANYYNSKQSEWQFVGIDFTVPQGATGVKVIGFMYDNMNNSQAELYFDHLVITEIQN
jgi:hypothetical protein